MVVWLGWTKMYAELINMDPCIWCGAQRKARVEEMMRTCGKKEQSDCKAGEENMRGIR